MTTGSWPQMAAHRERLLAIARRHCAGREDAEDLVSDAMLRCATFPGLDGERLEAVLVGVTNQLCAERSRRNERRVAHGVPSDGIAAERFPRRRA